MRISRAYRASTVFLVVCGCIQLTQASSLSGNCQTKAPKRTPELTVLIFNYADVHPSELCEMEVEARRFLSVAGIQVNLVSCSHQYADTPVCRGPMTPTQLLLRIIPGTRAKARALGLAMTSGTTGTYADLYWTQVRDMAGVDPELRGRLLGAVAAHEIGHLLIGTATHARTGIMKEDWGPHDLAKITNHKSFGFLSDECRSMRENVRKRLQNQTFVFNASNQELTVNSP